jgi:hypothetical protein
MITASIDAPSFLSESATRLIHAVVTRCPFSDHGPLIPAGATPWLRCLGSKTRSAGFPNIIAPNPETKITRSPGARAQSAFATAVTLDAGDSRTAGVASPKSDTIAGPCALADTSIASKRAAAANVPQTFIPVAESVSRCARIN